MRKERRVHAGFTENARRRDKNDRTRASSDERAPSNSFSSSSAMQPHPVVTIGRPAAPTLPPIGQPRLRVRSYFHRLVDHSCSVDRDVATIFSASRNAGLREAGTSESNISSAARAAGSPWASSSRPFVVRRTAYTRASRFVRRRSKAPWDTRRRTSSAVLDRSIPVASMMSV